MEENNYLLTHDVSFNEDFYTHNELLMDVPTGLEYEQEMDDKRNDRGEIDMYC